MAMATATNTKSLGARIAQAKAERAYAMMNAFQKASINNKKNG